MQDVQRSSGTRSAASLVGRHSGTASELPYRRVQSTCSDHEFAAALDAYRSSGGLAPAEELLILFRRGCGHELATLARWIVARQVISFAWQSRTWLPLFQLSPGDATPRRDLAPVLAALNAVHDDWQTAHWFATSNPWLEGCTPVSKVATDLPAVLLAARAVQPAAARLWP